MSCDAFSRLPIWERIHSSYTICPVTDCYKWTRDKSKSGYGRISYLSKREYAHRLIWIFKNGPIPDNLHVCHKCDNPGCINPDHLFIGTNHDNIKDKQRKGRASKKLRKEDVLKIREDIRTHKEIAKDYGIDRTMVGHIKRKTSWSHI